MAAEIEVKVPDIGDFEKVEVIDVLVSKGDRVQVEDSLISLESDKATMDIPSPSAGKVKDVKVKSGDKVSEGDLILTLEEAESADSAAGTDTEESPKKEAEPEKDREKETGSVEKEGAEPADQTDQATAEHQPPGPDSGDKSDSGPRPAPRTPETSITIGSSDSARAHASPSVRKFAGQLGVDLGLVRGSGRKGRILKEDVMSFTKAVMSGDRIFDRKGETPSLFEIPPVDFSRFGPVETVALNRLNRISAQNLHRSWINIPLVTQLDEADITELEEFRKSKKEEVEADDVKLTLLSFLIKAVVVALKKYPRFNASLAPNGEELILKKYFHIGVAVNTDQGLMVPVVKDADKKGIFDLAKEVAGLAQKARDKKLPREDMEGGCFTISSLGHIGGTGFTPLVNAPEVAILGVSKASIKPVYTDDGFEPRLILPFSLSYDHRVVDGVAAAEFTRTLSEILGDIRDLLL